MGMTATLVAVPDTKLDELTANPKIVVEYISEQVKAESSDAVLDIDKSWHGIHYLLTGESFGGAEPAALPIFGGVEIGEDMGYGPARYLRPPQVRAAAAALAIISVEELKRRYVPADLEAAQIYPTGIWEREGTGAFNWLVPWYESLKSFYSQAAKRGDAMLLMIV